jgi:hypothetical protein
MSAGDSDVLDRMIRRSIFTDTGIPAGQEQNHTVGFQIAQLITAYFLGWFSWRCAVEVHAEEFYKGKTIKFVVGYSEGCSIVSPDSLRATSVNTFRKSKRYCRQHDGCRRDHL